MTLTKEAKLDIVGKHGRHGTDTGSPEVQIALLTTRVNELTEVRGRINLNADTNGPTGSYQSPAFFALFAGLTVTNVSAAASQVITDDKITNIVAQLGTYRDSLPGSAFTAIGQLCTVTNMITDNASAAIPYTNDAAREVIIRNVANLITVRADSGVSEIIAWGQVVKGKGAVPGVTVKIRVKYLVEGNRIKIIKVQYLSPGS